MVEAHLLLSNDPWMDGDDEDDAEDDGQHRGGHVVHDGPATNLKKFYFILFKSQFEVLFFAWHSHTF